MLLGIVYSSPRHGEDVPINVLKQKTRLFSMNTALQHPNPVTSNDLIYVITYLVLIEDRFGNVNACYKLKYI